MKVTQIAPPVVETMYHLELTEAELLALRFLAGFHNVIHAEAQRQAKEYAGHLRRSDGDPLAVDTVLSRLWEQTVVYMRQF